MRTDTACQLIEQMTTKPGYRLTATPCDRFEACVVVRLDYPAPRFNREDAPAYSEEIEASAAFRLEVGDISEPVELYRKVLEDVLLATEAHEHREALRIAPTWWAPFHPHRTDGIKTWGDPQGDYGFGVV